MLTDGGGDEAKIEVGGGDVKLDNQTNTNLIHTIHTKSEEAEEEGPMRRRKTLNWIIGALMEAETLNWIIGACVEPESLNAN